MYRDQGIKTIDIKRGIALRFLWSYTSLLFDALVLNLTNDVSLEYASLS
ncbi:hypothetical protein Lepto7375DRAFT_4908 [Leptolyngbya sp. PCC 7375]|nr:hypothetical protein Lepto7375DRAFT_4908 [Leptolyngbya sp. PCC 7375]